MLQTYIQTDRATTRGPIGPKNTEVKNIAEEKICKEELNLIEILLLFSFLNRKRESAL